MNFGVISLLLVFCFLTLMMYILLNRDIMAPTVVMGMSYILAVLSTSYNAKIWNVNPCYKTFFILVGSYIWFAIMEIIVKVIWEYRFRIGMCRFETTESMREINIPNYYITLFSFFSILISGFLFLEEYRIASQHGYSGSGNFLTYYRMASSYGVLTLEEDVNQVVNQMYKLVTASGYVFLYVLLNNLIFTKGLFKDKWKRYFPIRIPVYIYLVSSLLSANRLQYLRFLAAGFIMFYIMWNRKTNWTRNISGKLLRYAIPIMVLVLILFSSLRGVVGRVNNQSTIDYITRYAGASIELFDQFVENPSGKTEYWGEETFHGAYTVLRKLKLSDYNKIGHLEFRRLGRTKYSSNTYTAIRRYYRDFGLMGVLILEGLTSVIYSYFYYFQIRTFGRESIFKDILYAFAYYAIPMYSINEIFYSSYISLSFIIQILGIWFVLFVVTRIRFVRGG